MTKAEQWFGKRKKDLNPKETKEYNKKIQKERRNRPEVQDYIKRISKEYQKNNREKINQAKREWNKKNPDKIKKYRNASFKREIALLEKALELACEMLCGLSVWEKEKFDEAIKDNCEYFKTKAKEIMKSE